ncbi:uncharacterized protein TNCV_3564531 [Trichonephila clavipes]|nr:uncharacterized protein TNCV_3564531 [Trichonephila clavipes]
MFNKRSEEKNFLKVLTGFCRDHTEFDKCMKRGAKDCGVEDSSIVKELLKVYDEICTYNTTMNASHRDWGMDQWMTVLFTDESCFNLTSDITPYLHWCAKIKDEVETLAYQLNEEAERTERPIRRLSKGMYGSTCTDMQVDVMGECLSSIKHVVGVRSVLLAKRLHAV